ncbi:hypothetical protein BMS3Bbin15_01182 [archaeon BMS3Bbin15]|nr:hypothetical protein BMS3Bbin15_01182 [archaeon BMS3Bbin15]
MVIVAVCVICKRFRQTLSIDAYLIGMKLNSVEVASFLMSNEPLNFLWSIWLCILYKNNGEIVSG